VPTAEPVTVEFDDTGNRIVISAVYRDNDLIKAVPGVIFDHKAAPGVWSVETSWPVCYTLRGIFGQRLVIGTRLSEWASGMAAWSNSVLSIRNAPDIAGNENEYSFQRVGSQWLKAVHYGLLADEMGTGKTVQACVALDELSTLDGSVSGSSTSHSGHRTFAQRSLAVASRLLRLDGRRSLDSTLESLTSSSSTGRGSASTLASRGTETSVSPRRKRRRAS
jgi:hypothetical protein